VSNEIVIEDESFVLLKSSKHALFANIFVCIVVVVVVGNSAVAGTKLKKGNKIIIAEMANKTRFFSFVLIHKMNIIIIQRIV
jgi:hypothetical protein